MARAAATASTEETRTIDGRRRKRRRRRETASPRSFLSLAPFNESSKSSGWVARGHRPSRPRVHVAGREAFEEFHKLLSSGKLETGRE